MNLPVRKIKILYYLQWSYIILKLIIQFICYLKTYLIEWRTFCGIYYITMSMIYYIAMIMIYYIINISK